MRTLFFFTMFIIAALTGCSTPPDMTATNTAIINVGTAIEANTAAIEANTPVAAPAPAPKPDPNACTIPTGMAKTAVDANGNAKATQDALVNHGTAIFDCDVETAPDGWRAWEVNGLHMGSAANNQDGLMVDSRGRAFKPSMLRGIASTGFVTVKGTSFKARCVSVSSTGEGCSKKKTEKPDTVMVINGRKVTISGS